MEKNLMERIMPALMMWSNLGVRNLDGTILIGPTPSVGSRAYLHTIFSPLEEEIIDKLERDLGGGINNKFIEFLRSANGCHLFSMAFVINGVRFNYNRLNIDSSRQPFDIRVRNIQRRPVGLSHNWIIIGGYDWGEGYDLILTPNGKVVCCKRGRYDIVQCEWSDFESMMESEVSRLVSLYNNLGEKIDPLTPTIPGDLESRRIPSTH